MAFTLQDSGTSTPSCSKATRAVPEVRDAGVAPLPGDLVVGVHTFGGEVPADADLGSLGGDGHGAGVLLLVFVLGVSLLACGVLLLLPAACRSSPSPHPQSSGAVSHGASPDPAPWKGSKVASPQYVVVGPSPRHEMLCHYSTVVTPLSTTCAHHSCRSQAVRDCLRAKPAQTARRGAEYPRRVSVSTPWPGSSSPSMRARPGCAPSPSTSRPGWPTSPTGS